MGTVLKVGVIVLPLIMFLAIFGQDIISRFSDNAGNTTSESDTLNSDATSSGFGG